jgi:hypothetical protein
MSSAAKRVAAVVGTIAVVAGIGRLIRASVPQVPSNTWTQTGDMAQARAGAAATLLFDGHVLVTGGHDANGAATATAERYAPDGGGFLDTPAMSTPRANHTSTLLPDGRVLVAGGVNASGQALSSAEIYDPSCSICTPTAARSRRPHRRSRPHAPATLPRSHTTTWSSSPAGLTEQPPSRRSTSTIRTSTL